MGAVFRIVIAHLSVTAAKLAARLMSALRNTPAFDGHRWP